jgi:hypothetical protein
MHADGTTLAHVPVGMKMIQTQAHENDCNGFVTRIWVGTTADDWPSVATS